MSAGKKILPPYEIVQAVSLGASFNSSPVSVERFDRVGLEIICTGTMTGSVAVQVSNDFVPPNRAISPSVSPATWNDMPLGLVPLAGVAQTYIVDIQEISFPWIRISFTRTGGAGSMTAVITAKES